MQRAVKTNAEICQWRELSNLKQVFVLASNIVLTHKSSDMVSYDTEVKLVSMQYTSTKDSVYMVNIKILIVTKTDVITTAITWMTITM